MREERREGKRKCLNSIASRECGWESWYFAIYPPSPERGSIQISAAARAGFAGPGGGGQSGQNTVWRCVDKTRQLLDLMANDEQCIHME